MSGPSGQPNLPAVLDAVRILSPLRTSPIHGEEHWRRVATNGLELAGAVGADPLVAVLFGIFHDAMRFDEYRDEEHGKRGGFLACCINSELIGLSEDRLDLLYLACAGHSNGETSDDPTIGVCWDADRLDLCRLGEQIRPESMSTAPGRTVPALRRATALLTATPEWASIFRRLDGVTSWFPAAGPAVRTPAVVENRPASPDPSAGRRYWTATLLNAPSPAPGDAEDRPS